AFLKNRRCSAGIDNEIIADFVCPAEYAIVRARDCVHERCVIANDRAREFFNLGNNDDLAAVRLKIGIVNELAGTNAGAVDQEMEFGGGVFEFFEAGIGSY